MEKWTEVWTTFSSFTSSSNRREREALAEFFSDPSRWGDCRLQKENVRYPDFKHKKKNATGIVGRGRPTCSMGGSRAGRNGTKQRHHCCAAAAAVGHLCVE
jgi:hypothetical protein